MMEDTGLVKRDVVSLRPIAVTYELTEFGKTAIGFLPELKNWAEINKRPLAKIFCAIVKDYFLSNFA